MKRSGLFRRSTAGGSGEAGRGSRRATPAGAVSTGTAMASARSAMIHLKNPSEPASWRPNVTAPWHMLVLTMPVKMGVALAPERNSEGRISCGTQHLHGQRPRDRPLAAERFAIEVVHGRAGGRERAFQAGHEVGDETFIDPQLAVGKQLDQHGAEERVVRRRQPHIGNGAQPRRQVGKRESPGCRSALRRDQNGGLMLAREVEEMKKGPL